MKFAKELEQDLVPEWRAKYLDYKGGKKRVKAVARAYNRMNATPRTPARTNLAPQKSKYGSISPFAQRPKAFPSTSLTQQNEGLEDPLRESPAPPGTSSRPDSYGSLVDAASHVKKTPPMPIAANNQYVGTAEGMYGSFVATPPSRATAGSFLLPDPAVAPDEHVRDILQPAMTPSGTMDDTVDFRPSGSRRASEIIPDNAYEVGKTTSPHHRSTFASLRHQPSQNGRRPLMRRIFSVGTPLTPAQSSHLDVDMVVVDQVRMRQKEFLAWMDRELEKVESFYKMKEDEAGARLETLREQLHEMRNRRIEEVAELQQAKHKQQMNDQDPFSNGHSKKDDDERPNSRDRLSSWFDPLERKFAETKAKAAAKTLRPGPNSKALQKMPMSPGIATQVQEDGRDYVRRPVHDDRVSYRTAKRKLKLALQEFYRGMELLKSYALLNRIAFRKINKKYDKAINAHPPLRYMSDKVNKAWFVKSDVIDGHLHAVEDLYARYFERGNHKVATGKLRSSTSKHRDKSANAFRNGIFIGIGAVFAIQGVIYASDLLLDDDPTVVTQTSYLLQIYGGYFLGLYLFSWFCLDCAIWSMNRINYQFVFEFDTRHSLDWRELSEFPSFLILVLGLFLWLNFTRYGAPEMYLYYPVILMFTTLLLIFLPARVIFYRSRKWFVYSLWRLFWAGIYPVEFRDFFLGDMFCSLTYLTSNIELFFCLYANHWNNPSQCNSTHSRLLGFFAALPGIWRALQCLRRYNDTRNIFPHLVNCGKYVMTIMYYVTLSMYRINRTNRYLAVFVTFATINAIYCSIWDILMDWSLLQPHASKKFLRDVRGYRNPNYYYAVMILDPILRFNWIFYAIYTQDLQHSTIVSFLVAFSEATRRGLWVIFRVENEHCSNVARFKASRDVPLPYDLPCELNRESTEILEECPVEAVTTQALSPTLSRLQSRTGAGLEAQQTHESNSTLRRRLGPLRAITRLVANAHTQDFEKKRKPGADAEEISSNRGDGGANENDQRGSSSDEDDDEEQNEEDVLQARALLKRRSRIAGDRERDGEGPSGNDKVTE